MKLPTLLYFAIIVVCVSCTNKTLEVNAVTVQDTVAIEPVIDTVIVTDSTITKERFYDNLSYTHNYKLSYFENFRGKDKKKSHWTIAVYDKKMKLVDSIIQPTFVYFSEWIDFSTACSYITGINRNIQVVDNYEGDFVVADFNFDNKNDFAIINDMGGNGGTFYSYYIQEDKNKFIEDKFLTDSVTYFPTIDKKNRTLTTHVHAGVCWMGEHIYTQTKSGWKQLSHRRLDICNPKNNK
jgi:hypothetical protein